MQKRSLAANTTKTLFGGDYDKDVWWQLKHCLLATTTSYYFMVNRENNTVLCLIAATIKACLTGTMTTNDFIRRLLRQERSLLATATKTLFGGEYNNEFL